MREVYIKSFGSWKEQVNESLATARRTISLHGNVDAVTFGMLKDLDPTPTFKYIDKIVKFYINESPSIKELGDLISKYHMLLSRNQVKTRDINAFKTLDQLRSEVSDSGSRYEVKERSKDVDVVYEDRNFLVVIPRTHEASCKYGAGTKWCTTAEHPVHWEKYTYEKKTLYYILDKNKPMDDPTYKLSVVIYPESEGGGISECRNALEKKVSFESVIEMTGLDPEMFVPNPTALAPYKDMNLERSLAKRNKDGTINYDGNVVASFSRLEKLSVRFNHVEGDFEISDNYLTSLYGSPREVEGKFDCSNNRLTTLVGGPEIVHGDFYCNDNKLTSLEGAPKVVGGIFYCDGNKLTAEDEKWARENIKANGYEF